MTELLKEFMKEYSINNDVLVSSEMRYYKLLELITNNIQNMLSDDYLVKCSCGQGRKSECPWICIFNKNITKSAKEGIYCAILFKSDMSGFYLSLCLGMESFKEKFKSEWENNLTKVANYFRNKIVNKDFNLNSIDLKVNKNTRGYGYEVSNVIAKYYDISLNKIELEKGIKDLIDIYSDISNIIIETSYSEIIDNILSNTSTSLIDIARATEEMEQAMLKEANTEEAEIVTLREIEIPNAHKKCETKYVEMQSKKVKKKDYLSSVKKQMNTGLRGEQLVIEYEKQKMINNNREDLIDKINWVSEIDDSRGYDIESFDFDEEGNEYRIYIEVKTTESNEKNAFIITSNELNALKLNKDKYWIYRVGKLKNEPVFFKINGNEFDNVILLKEYTYYAEIK